MRTNEHKKNWNLEVKSISENQIFNQFSSPTPTRSFHTGIRTNTMNPKSKEKSIEGWMVYDYPSSWSWFCLSESPIPTASNAFQPFVHKDKAYPVTLKSSDDSKTKLRIPNLHDRKWNHKHQEENWETIDSDSHKEITKWVHLWSPNAVVRPPIPAPTIKTSTTFSMSSSNSMGAKAKEKTTVAG